MKTNNMDEYRGLGKAVFEAAIFMYAYITFIIILLIILLFLIVMYLVKKQNDKQNETEKEKKYVPQKVSITVVIAMLILLIAPLIFLILLHQLNREELVRSNGGERQGRKPQAYWRMERFSDVEFLRQDEQKNSGFNWWSNNIPLTNSIIICYNHLK